MGRKRCCELAFCKGLVEGTHNKRRCDNDRNIHLHQIISRNVKKIMGYIESQKDFSANDITRDLFHNKLDKNEKGSMYRLFQAMVREKYLLDFGKRDGLKIYSYNSLRSGKKSAPKPRVSSKKPPLSSPPCQPISCPQVSPREQLLSKLVEFVIYKMGSWDHNDWLSLIQRSDIRELGFSESEIGLLLEDEKRQYWAHK